jgi:hypothetical protein
VRPLEAVIYFIVHGAEDPGVNMPVQQPVITQGLDPGSSLPETGDDIVFPITDGGDGRAGGNDNASLHGIWLEGIRVYGMRR